MYRDGTTVRVTAMSLGEVQGFLKTAAWSELETYSRPRTNSQSSAVRSRLVNVSSHVASSSANIGIQLNRASFGFEAAAAAMTEGSH
jgi:hypothetical protein